MYDLRLVRLPRDRSPWACFTLATSHPVLDTMQVAFGATAV